MDLDAFRPQFGAQNVEMMREVGISGPIEDLVPPKYSLFTDDGSSIFTLNTAIDVVASA